MTRRIVRGRALAALLALSPLLLAPAARAAECHRPARPEALEPLRRAMAEGRFVAYQPTDIRIYDGVPTRASEKGIEQDLRALRGRFDGLITYGSSNGAERVADVAARLGFRAVIPGVWSLDDPRELENALAAARRNPGVVVGLAFGNERIFAKERAHAAVAEKLREVRARAGDLPVSTSEPFHLFVQPEFAILLRELDFLLPNVHPAFQPWFRQAGDADAAQFVVNVVDELAAVYCGPILVKETGVPTAPASLGFTPRRQSAFFAALRDRFPPSRDRAFAYFTAFDAAWRVHDEHPVEGAQPQEGSWGLWTEERRPKPAASELPLLRR